MDNKRNELTGYILAAASAITFSAKGIFAKILYGYGLDPVTLLALRFLIALPFFWITVFFFPSGKVSPKDMLLLVLSGLMGLYGAAVFDFYGLLYIEASLERIILYTYPAMVVVLAAFVFKERVGKRKLFAIALTYLGLILALDLFKDGLRAELKGAALVFLSAVIYSVTYLLTEALGKRVSGVKMAAYTTTAATFACVGTWHGKSVPAEPEVWGLLFALAAVSTYVPVLTLTLGIRRIGASRAALVSFVGPVSTAILANIILGESMGVIQIAGMLLVLTGVVVISTDRPSKAEEA